MKFYYISNDTRLGPFSLEEMKHQGITPDTLVWHKGMPDWKEAATLPELADYLAPPIPTSSYDDDDDRFEDEPVDDDYAEEIPIMPSAREPEPQPRHYTYAGAPSRVAEAADPEKKKSKAGFIALFSVLVVLALVCMMMLTKPSREEYVDVVGRNTTDYIVEHIDKSVLSESETLAGTAKFATSKAVGMLLEHGVTVEDHFLYNQARLSIGDRSFTIGYGLFGHVFTYDKEEIARAVEQYIAAERKKVEESTIGETVGEVIDFGVETAKALGVDKQIEEAFDSIKVQAVQKGGEIIEEVKKKGSEFIDETKEKAKEKLAETAEDLLNELRN